MHLHRVVLVQVPRITEKIEAVRTLPLMPELPSTPISSTASSVSSSKDIVLAYRLLWLTFILFFAGTGFGKLWDRIWHLTHKFESFFSPPHMFITCVTAFTGIMALTLAFSPRFRTCFGLRTYVPFLHTEVAGSLTILGAGLISLCLAIGMDSIWHTAFGLDETMWSLPHDMLPLSWCVVILGFVSSRLAMRSYKPLDWLTKTVFAVLILAFLCPPILGPLYLNYSLSLLHAFANLHINLIQPTIEHTYRIYITAQLSRQSTPLFIPLVTFFAGIAINMLHLFNKANPTSEWPVNPSNGRIARLLRWLDKNVSIVLLAPILWSCIFCVRDVYTVWFVHYDGVSKVRDLLPILLKEPSLWVPIPLFVAAVLFVLFEKTSLDERWKWLINGAFFGLLTFFIWHTSIWMVLLIVPSAPLMLLGAHIGKVIYRVLERPIFADILRMVLTTNAQIPAVLGVVDLILRHTIS